MSNEPAREPIWMNPEPGTRKSKLSRRQIAEAAIEIADEEGFGAVSMRRVAERLDAGTMSLYHYIRNKDDLMALIDDRLIEEVLIPEGEVPGDWREALTQIAHRSYRAWVKRPWLLAHMGDGPRVGPNMMRHIDQSIGAVSGLGLSPAEQFELISMIDDYTLGYVLGDRDAVSLEENDWSGLDQMASHTAELIQTGEYPHLEAFLGATDEESVIASWREIARQLSDGERFERGLERLLDGIAIYLERRAA